MAKLNIAAIVAATLAGSFVHVNDKDKEVAKAIKDGFIEVNPTITNDAGEVAARATAAGIEKFPAADTSTASAPVATPAPATNTYARIVVPASAVPAVTRTAPKREHKYPFDDLAAPMTDEAGNVTYDSFFVPPTAEMPEPWEAIKPTASLAQRRHATVIGEKPGKNSKGEDIMRKEYEHTRKFRVIEYDNAGVKGALVSRVM